MLEIPVVSALSTGHHEVVITAVTDPHLGFSKLPKECQPFCKKTETPKQLGISKALQSLHPCCVLQDLVDVKDVH